MKNLRVILFSAVIVLLATSAVFAQTSNSVSQPDKNVNVVTPNTSDRNSGVGGVDKKYIVIGANGEELIMIAPPEESKSEGDLSKPEEKQSNLKKEKEDPK